MKFNRQRMGFGIALLALSLGACGGAKEASKANFKKAIQARLDTRKGVCAALPTKQFPFKVLRTPKSSGSKSHAAQATALQTVGLIRGEDAELPGWPGPPVPATEYQLTEAGREFLVVNGAGTFGEHLAFCFGKLTVQDVGVFTEPTDGNVTKYSEVNYTYKVDGAPDWARHPSVQAAFEDIAKLIAGDVKSKTTLVLTNEGWMHPDQMNQRKP